MVDVFINGKKTPALKNIGLLKTLFDLLERFASLHQGALTSLQLNGQYVDVDAMDLNKVALKTEDIVHARVETAWALAFESLQMAIDMSDLLVLDIKKAMLAVWHNSDGHESVQRMEALLNDCHLFLSLAARPVSLFEQNPTQLPLQAMRCLETLDTIAHNVQDATMLAMNSHGKEACHVLLRNVCPAIERWLGLVPVFSEIFGIGYKDQAMASLPTGPFDTFFTEHI